MNEKALQKALQVPAPDWAKAAAAKLIGTSYPEKLQTLPEPERSQLLGVPQCAAAPADTVRAPAFRNPPCNGFPLPDAAPFEFVCEDLPVPWEQQALEERRAWHRAPAAHTSPKGRRSVAGS